MGANLRERSERDALGAHLRERSERVVLGAKLRERSERVWAAARVGYGATAAVRTRGNPTRSMPLNIPRSASTPRRLVTQRGIRASEKRRRGWGEPPVPPK